MIPKSQLVELAKGLPAPLMRFFARWPPASIATPGTRPTFYQKQRPNPFEFYQHPKTKRIQDPVYSARRQAQLLNMAREHGVLELMPASAKHPDQRLARRVEFGLRVKGTGIGQKVKGHVHERHMISKMEQKRKAMLEMPELIRSWRNIGRRRWRKWPK